jgi:hypothetical protein
MLPASLRSFPRKAYLCELLDVLDAQAVAPSAPSVLLVTRPGHALVRRRILHAHLRASHLLRHPLVAIASETVFLLITMLLF